MFYGNYSRRSAVFSVRSYRGQENHSSYFFLNGPTGKHSPDNLTRLEDDQNPPEDVSHPSGADFDPRGWRKKSFSKIKNKKIINSGLRTAGNS